MERDLLPDETPIEAGPIVIDDDYAFNELEEDHVRYGNFVIEALHHKINASGSIANVAMCISVEALIQHLGLRILPPYESVRIIDDEVWGPHDPHSYFIELKAFCGYYDEIIDHARNSTDDERVIDILGFVKELAEDELSFDTEPLTVDELEGAIYTEKYPKKHLEEGNLIAYSEFANAIYLPISTSSGKVAQVFDRVALRLGSDRVKLELKKLEVLKNAFDRKYIRESIYIKTQSLADLVEELSLLPEKERLEFNNLSMQILRFVLNDEAQEE